jgi:hypothetical protein
MYSLIPAFYAAERRGIDPQRLKMQQSQIMRFGGFVRKNFCEILSYYLNMVAVELLG